MQNHYLRQNGQPFQYCGELRPYIESQAIYKW